MEKGVRNIQPCPFTTGSYMRKNSQFTASLVSRFLPPQRSAHSYTIAKKHFLIDKKAVNEENLSKNSTEPSFFNWRTIMFLIV